MKCMNIEYCCTYCFKHALLHDTECKICSSAYCSHPPESMNHATAEWFHCSLMSGNSSSKQKSHKVLHISNSPQQNHIISSISLINTHPKIDASHTWIINCLDCRLGFQSAFFLMEVNSGEYKAPNIHNKTMKSSVKKYLFYFYLQGKQHIALYWQCLFELNKVYTWCRTSV